jgi:hypothetical protein
MRNTVSSLTWRPLLGVGEPVVGAMHQSSPAGDRKRPAGEPSVVHVATEEGIDTAKAFGVHADPGRVGQLPHVKYWRFALRQHHLGTLSFGRHRR